MSRPRFIIRHEQLVQLSHSLFTKRNQLRLKNIAKDELLVISQLCRLN